MKITEFSIKRPMTLFVMVLVVLILGAVSLSRLNVDLYPEMNLPVGAVITEYPGAGPQEVENLVTRPLESILGTVSNLDTIQSVSSMGSSTVIVMFEWGSDMDFAALQMREKVDLIKAFFPDGVNAPAVFKMDPNMLPVIQLAVSGNNATQLKQLVDDVIQPRLERVGGVAAVRSMGGEEREIQVLVDQARLQGYGLTLNGLTQVLKGENLNVSGGQVLDGKKDLLVRVTGEFKDIEQIRNVVVGSPGGVPVHLSDVAEVKDTHKKATQLSRVDGKPGMTLLINKQSGANTVKVAKAVDEALKELEPQLPKDIGVKKVLDQSEYIEQSINNVIKETILGGLLAIVVLIVFLRNVRSTLIISTAIPISIIATFVLMYFNNMTLNLMSLGGLALGIGLIVDDAIVVLENIYRHRQQGYGLVDAARAGTAEVANPVIASTLTTIGVFLPIVFVEGLAAQLFKPMALTVSFSIAASLAVALTLVPMLSSRWLTLDKRPDEHKKWGRVYRASENYFEKLNDSYKRLLVWALNHRKRVIVIVAAMFVASLALFPLIGAEFMPKMDQGMVTVTAEMPNGTALEETNKVAASVEKIAMGIPEVESIFTTVGFTGSQSMGGTADTDQAQVSLKLKPRNQRSLTADEVAEKMRLATNVFPGVEIKVAASDPNSDGGGGGSPVEVRIKGDDLDKLTELGNQSVDLIKSVPGTRQVTSNLSEGRPEVQVLVDRDRAASYGLSPAEVANTVRTAIQGSVATRYRTGGEEYDIRVQLLGGDDALLNDLSGLTVSSPTGMQVPLRQVAELKVSDGPNTINRYEQSRTVVVSSQLLGRDLGSVTKDIQAKLKSLEIPPGYTIEYGGQNKEMQKAFGNLGLALILAIILVYLIMVGQFESLLHPFIIMFSVPVTIIGVVLSLLLTGRAFSVPAFVGIILLVGIVVKNAIVLIDYVNVLRRRGMSREEAILKAGPTRLRPILMTALTAILAMFPMALGLGEGGEGQAPMATVVVGGLAFSTLITLVLVPVVYTSLDDLKDKRLTRRKNKKLRKQADAAPEGL